MKEVIRIHKLNKICFIEKRLVVNVHDEFVYEKRQVLYTQIKNDKVTLFVPYEYELKQHKNYHVNAIINLFNRTFISNYRIKLYLLDNGNIYFHIYSVALSNPHLPSCHGYINKKEGKISFNSSLDGISFYRHYMWDMFREMTDKANYNIARKDNWFTYESE